MKTLIIAEKPSVARDIAHALGITKGMENTELVISHCIGHLVELHVPEAEERNAPLPIIHETFNLAVKEAVKEQYQALKKLMERNDITTIVNACDAGREGELIFRLVYDKANCTKPIERMWLQSMTAEAIVNAWQNRKPGTQYQALYEAAKSRSEADWLYGINGSRAVKSAVGRVMTPTLAMVVERYKANKHFQTSAFYEVVATCKAQAGQYVGKWIDETEKEAKLTDKAQAQAIVDKLQSPNTITVTDETKPKQKLPPLLFHLSSLQQVANSKYGYSAADTLAISQTLYERHKAITYPRTDANALPEDYLETAQSALAQLGVAYPAAQVVLDNQWATTATNKRIFNNQKISDHFAIIPTCNVIANLSSLSEKEANIYQLIVNRFIAVFYPAAEYQQTVRITHIDQERFRSTGSVLVDAGWLDVYAGEEEDKEDKSSLVAVDQNEAVTLQSISVVTGKTKPPALFTEATLLKAMETAGKQVDDEELANVLKGKGLGTPATRAAMIEKLKNTGKFGAYMEMKKKVLVPTERGLKLIAHLSQKAPSFISPELTGEWEFKLLEVEQGQLARDSFMQQVNQAVHDLVKALANSPNPLSSVVTIGCCPVCRGKELQDRKFSYMCECGFRINKEYAKHKLTKAQLAALINKGRTAKIDKFVSKAGKGFSATLKIVDKKVSFEF